MQKDGSTRRQHLLAVEARGIDTGELVPPPVPSDCRPLLQTFWELRRAAGSNAFGKNPITYSELAAWQSLYGVQLQPFEVDLLLHMDRAAIAAANESQD